MPFYVGMVFQPCVIVMSCLTHHSAQREPCVQSWLLENAIVCWCEVFHSCVMRISCFTCLVPSSNVPYMCWGSLVLGPVPWSTLSPLPSGVLQLPYLGFSVQWIIVYGILVCQLLLGYSYMSGVPHSGAGKNGSTVAVSLGSILALSCKAYWVGLALFPASDVTRVDLVILDGRMTSRWYSGVGKCRLKQLYFITLMVWQSCSEGRTGMLTLLRQLLLCLLGESPRRFILMHKVIPCRAAILAYLSFSEKDFQYVREIKYNCFGFLTL